MDERERHLHRQLAKIGGDAVGTPDWLDVHPELVNAARALAEAGLARAVVDHPAAA